MIFAGKALLQDDYAVAYAAGARVIHSHNYNCRQQFKRNFDLAVSQATIRSSLAACGRKAREIRLVKSTALSDPPGKALAGAGTGGKERF